MGLNKFQLTKCLEIVDHLINWSMCAPFVNPSDPKEEPDYDEIIKEPICLTDIKKKAQANEYEDIKDFEKDVNLVWSNAKLYNGEDTLYFHLAGEAELWFKKKMENFPATAEEEWTGKLQRTTKHLIDVLNHPPPELDPNGKLTVNSDDPEEEKKNVEPIVV